MDKTIDTVEKLRLLKKNGYEITWSRILQTWALNRGDKMVTYLIDCDTSDDAVRSAYGLVDWKADFKSACPPNRRA